MRQCRIGVARAVTWRIKALPCVMLQICCPVCSVTVVKVVQHEAGHTNKSARMRLEMVLVLEHTQQLEDKEAAFVIY